MRARLCAVITTLATLGCGANPIEGIWAGSCQAGPLGFNLDIDDLALEENTLVEGSGTFEVYSSPGRLVGDGFDSDAVQVQWIQCVDENGCSTEPEPDWSTDDVFMSFTLTENPGQDPLVATGSVDTKEKTWAGTCWWDRGGVYTGDMELVHLRKAPEDR